jgi:hypothetical protein
VTEIQAAALMMSANNALSHLPPMTWLCYSLDGANGAKESNLSLGVFGVKAVDGYMDDFGPGNTAVGHRRWVLYPPRAGMATGDTNGNAANRPANSLYVFGPVLSTRPATPNGVAWPPAGFVPYQSLPATSNRWSFSYPGAGFAGASVMVNGPSGPFSVTLEAVSDGFGDNTLVYLPAGFSYAKPAADTSYAIQISGMSGAGVPATIQYIVTVIDPATTSNANYQGLWWNAPAASEDGWGINFAHQGDTIFATWFTYDLSGRGWWLVMTATKTATNTYTGTLFQTHGPAFNAMPFAPKFVATAVGTGTLTFSDTNNGTFAYTVNGFPQSKTLTRQVFGPLPTCTYGAQPNLALATNYQDLWWNAPAASEDGWGINFTHQGDTLFATWFTYDLDGTPLWLVVTAPKTATGTYTGTLYRTTGPAFNAIPFAPKFVATEVGSATFTFADGNHATFEYTVQLAGMPSPVTQIKQITRQLFAVLGTACQ